MKAIEAAKLVAVLAGAYPNTKFTEETSQVYEGMLADLELEPAQLAVQRLIRTSKWFPTIAEIRQAAADIEHGPVRTGMEAWGDVLAEIRRTGSYGLPRFADPLVAECVRGMTWRALCRSDNEAADRARFVELYDALAARKRVDVVAGHSLPSGPCGLALPPATARQLASPGETVTASELLSAIREPETVVTGRRMTAEQLDAELAKAGQ